MAPPQDAAAAFPLLRLKVPQSMFRLTSGMVAEEESYNDKEVDKPGEMCVEVSGDHRYSIPKMD